MGEMIEIIFVDSVDSTTHAARQYGIHAAHVDDCSK